MALLVYCLGDEGHASSVGGVSGAEHTLALLVLLVGLSSLVGSSTGNQLVSEASLVLLGLGVVPLLVGRAVLGVVLRPRG